MLETCQAALELLQEQQSERTRATGRITATAMQIRDCIEALDAVLPTLHPTHASVQARWHFELFQLALAEQILSANLEEPNDVRA